MSIFIPNEVLSDISCFVPNYKVPNLTFLMRSFAAAFAPRLKRINEEIRSKMAEQDFEKFFVACKIPDDISKQYATRFAAEEIQPSTLSELDEGKLEKLGVEKMGHQIAVLRYIRTYRGAIPKEFRENVEAEQVHLSDEAIPAVEKFQIEYVNANIIGVKWNGSNEKDISGYLLEYKSKDDEEWKEQFVQSDHPKNVYRADIKDLKESTAYFFKLCAVGKSNAKGAASEELEAVTKCYWYSERLRKQLPEYIYFLRKTGDQQSFASEQEVVYKNCVTVVSETNAVTAAHCMPKNCWPLHEFFVYHTNGDKVRVRLKLLHKEMDFAWLECINGARFANFPRTNDAEVGQKVYCVGFPAPMFSQQNAVQEDRFGIVEASVMQRRCQPTFKQDPYYLRVYPGLFGGNSGGGLFDYNGALIGINIAGKDPANYNSETVAYSDLVKHTLEPAYSYVVPIDTIVAIANQHDADFKERIITPNLTPEVQARAKKFKPAKRTWTVLGDNEKSNRFIAVLETLKNDHEIIEREKVDSANPMEEDDGNLDGGFMDGDFAGSSQFSNGDQVPSHFNAPVFVYVSTPESAQEVICDRTYDSCNVVCEAPLSIFGSTDLQSLLERNATRSGNLFQVVWMKFHWAWRHFWEVAKVAKLMTAHYKVAVNENLQENFKSYMHELFVFMRHLFPDKQATIESVVPKWDQDRSILGITVNVNLADGKEIRLSCGRQDEPSRIYFDQKYILEMFPSFIDPENVALYKTEFYQPGTQSQKSLYGQKKLMPRFETGVVRGLKNLDNWINDADNRNEYFFISDEMLQDVAQLIENANSKLEDAIENQNRLLTG